ncbi:hypothetical protein [Streptosporangium sp. NPDC006930]|uniref:hypothetical protein n=1 Tax=Streptosporangium sp. NPDC006930 TaxID=3154783 RepID=UPI00341A0BD5
MTEQTFEELTAHQQGALMRLHRVVADLGEIDLMSLGGICHFLRPDLEGESLVLAEVLDALRRLVVATWLIRRGEPDGDMNALLTELAREFHEYRASKGGE